jgi:hypothetical protein
MPIFRRRSAAVFEADSAGAFDIEVRGESFHMDDVLASARRPNRTIDGDRLRCEIHVTLRREPHNKYDGNAIVVLGESGRELGHVARETAALYAPVLDAARVPAVRCSACVFGRLVDGVGWRAGVWLDLPSPAALARGLGRGQ